MPYMQTLTSTGGTGNLSWSLTGGTLPAGLSLNTLTGAISGTPTLPATNTPLTFQVTDSSSPPETASATLPLTIIPLPTISTSSLPNGNAGTPYSAMLTATGGAGPYTWALLAGGHFLQG